MTLDELAVLVGLATPRRDGWKDSSALDALEHQQLIEQKGPMWMPTERGRVLLEHIVSLPLPMPSWSMPGPHSEYRPQSAASILHIASIEEDDDGPAPPAPPAKRARIIEDPGERQAEAMRLMQRGFGLNEIKEELALSNEDMSAYFGKWS